MRLIPVLTAIVVTLTLYAAVFEREALLAFARGNDAASAEAGTEARAETGAASAGAGAAPQVAQIGVVVVKSVAQSIDDAVILRGETRAARQVEVRAETSANVISEPLRKGAMVKAGDLLCRLDPGTREATLAEARARLAEARAKGPEAQARVEEANAMLDEAQINYNAAEKLLKDGYASETRLKSAAAAVRSAEAAIAAAMGETKDEEARGRLVEISAACAAGETYQALTRCRKLMKAAEAENG